MNISCSLNSYITKMLIYEKTFLLFVTALIYLPLCKMLRILKQKLLISVFYSFNVEQNNVFLYKSTWTPHQLYPKLYCQFAYDRSKRKKTLRASINILTKENGEQEMHTCGKCISCQKNVYIRTMGKETFNTFI